MRQFPFDSSIESRGLIDRYHLIGPKKPHHLTFMRLQINLPITQNPLNTIVWPAAQRLGLQGDAGSPARPPSPDDRRGLIRWVWVRPGLPVRVDEQMPADSCNTSVTPSSIRPISVALHKDEEYSRPESGNSGAEGFLT